MRSTESLLPLFLIALVLLFAIASTLWRRSRVQRRFDVKICPHCGVSQPAHAGYCRQCGQRV